MLQERALPRPESTPTDCRHSKSAFDMGFRSIVSRTDLSSDAKLVHGALVTVHRTEPRTQVQIGALVGLTRHRVWSAIQELIRAGLVTPIRVGLGNPNQYVLEGIDAADLDGRRGPETGSRPRSGGSSPAQSGPRAREPFTPRRANEKNRKSNTTLQSGQCAGCGGPHDAAACPTWGHVLRR